MIVPVDPVGLMIVVVLTTAALAAVCGYVAALRRQANQRNRGYFVLGVLAGVLGRAVVLRRLRRLPLFDNPLTGAALHLRRSVSRTGITR
ncbi:hypothetical protein H7J51_23815 [Mycobacterium crocinum]|uniref:Uncharacterized protein n=1 Tax=Mycolicibacterium crocinum TaxID=388459 RepID=A0ABY3TTV4_9MYCO|nr:hypothetical protein [Mycolicibacterium crocinum]MCV7218298.1 hypothetical protein [Mycolicibacterium crocinum]ULN43439.1 hypothetical protein MI149_10430 [Mycolicibacterium crocinum]